MLHSDTLSPASSLLIQLAHSLFLSFQVSDEFLLHAGHSSRHFISTVLINLLNYPVTVGYNG